MLRIENKYGISRDKKVLFFKWINNNKIKKLFPSRCIYSIYFDNNNYDIYTNSIEGNVPRKKIRLRKYDFFSYEINNFVLETKETNFTTRSKKILREFSRNILTNGYYDKMYGNCYPKIIVTYKRDYFVYKSHRITFDENIQYGKFDILQKNLVLSSTNDIIIEVKNNNISKSNEIDEIFPFAKTRFSKYTNGVDQLRLI